MGQVGQGLKKVTAVAGVLTLAAGLVLPDIGYAQSSGGAGGGGAGNAGGGGAGSSSGGSQGGAASGQSGGAAASHKGSGPGNNEGPATPSRRKHKRR